MHFNDSDLLSKTPKDLEISGKTLFRYMSISKFYHLLMTDKYPLTCLKHFGEDKKELPILKQLLDEINGNNSVITEFVYNFYRSYSFSSSWSLNEDEDIGMWERYTNQDEGIVIKTTADKLLNALDLSPVSTIREQAPNIHIKEIIYVKKSDVQTIQSRSLNEIHEILPCAHYHKPQLYSSEKEVRIGYRAFSDASLNLLMSKSLNDPKNDKLLRDLDKDLGNDSHPIGYKTGLDKLIDEVRIRPFGNPRMKDSVERMVSIINEQRVKIRLSDISHIPIKDSELYEQSDDNSRGISPTLPGKTKDEYKPTLPKT